jgi:hypothetical protein
MHVYLQAAKLISLVRDEKDWARFFTASRSDFLKSLAIYDFRPILPKIIAI